MADRIELARRVFEIFRREYEKREDDPTAQWWFNFDGDDDTNGLDEKELKTGLGVLLHKGILERMGMDGYALSEDGRDICIHPELLEDGLAPRRSAIVVAQEFNINAEQMHNTQVGGTGNTMNVTYAQALTTLADKIEASADIPAEQKRTWSTTARDIAKHPISVGLVLAGVKLATDKLMGK